MKKILLLHVFIICILNNSMAQQVDVVSRKVQALIDSCKANQADNVKANRFANEAIAEAQKTKSNVSIAEAMSNKARLLRHYLKYSKSIKYYNKAIAAYQKADKQSEVAELLRVSGRFYYELGDYEMAMKRYMEGLSICEKLNFDNTTKGWLLRYIGSIFKQQGNHQKALDYYRKAYAELDRVNDIDGMSSCLNNIGIVYGNIGQDSLQLVYYKKALKLTEDNDLRWRASIILDNIGSVYTTQNDFDKAMECFDKSFSYLSSEANPDYTFLSTNMQNKAALYIRKNELDSALEALEKAESYIAKTEKKRRMESRDIYELYSKLYAKKKDYKKAYEYHLRYNDIENSLQNSKIGLEVAHIQFEHDQEKTKLKLASGKQLSDIKFANQKSWLIYLIIGILVLAIFTVIIFIQKKKLSIAYIYLAEGLEKEMKMGQLKSRIVSIVSHQLRTPLTVIKASMSLFDMQKGAVAEELRPNFDKLTKRVNEQVDNMATLMNQALVLGKIDTGNVKPSPEKIDLVKLCKKICKDINEIQEDGRKTELIVIGRKKPAILDPVLLNHAMSNLLMNAFKYSEGRPKPTVTINYGKSDIRISIKDRGMGIPQTDLEHLFEPFFRATNVSNISGTGLGTSVAKEYIELLEGTLSVTSEQGIGSEFIITLYTTTR